MLDSHSVLENAKAELNGIIRNKKLNRLIAEVDGENNLIRDPHVVGGQRQNAENGFNHFWHNWDSINRLMDMGQKYLDEIGIFIELLKFQSRIFY